ncbi:MAG: AzlC family ABC transporter permease [Pseudomonadota bacterium]
MRGARAGAPFLIVVAPFAMVFGVVASEAGLTLFETMAFSILVIGGASQFTALQLMTENATTLVVLSAALAVNLRMAMYSAALAPHLGAAPVWQRLLIGYLNFDQSFAVATAEYEARPHSALAMKVAYFFGVAVPTGAVWWIFTLVGALAGGAIPESFAIDFAVPIAFLAIVAPGLKSLAHVATAFTSAVLAIALSGLPSGLGLIIAAGIAMSVGAEIERRSARA